MSTAEQIQIVLSVPLGRWLLGLVVVAPVFGWLAWDQFKGLRDDLRQAHQTLNRLLAEKGQHLREVRNG